MRRVISRDKPPSFIRGAARAIRKARIKAVLDQIPVHPELCYIYNRCRMKPWNLLLGITDLKTIMNAFYDMERHNIETIAEFRSIMALKQEDIDDIKAWSTISELKTDFIRVFLASSVSDESNFEFANLAFNALSECVPISDLPHFIDSEEFYTNGNHFLTSLFRKRLEIMKHHKP